MARVAVVGLDYFGLDYFGLPSATVLALRGFDVLGVDVSPSIVDMLKQGKIHIVEPDLAYLEAAARSIAPHPSKSNLVILESTSPVGTTRKVSGWISEERTDLKLPHEYEEADVNLSHCPERVLPGRI